MKNFGLAIVALCILGANLAHSNAIPNDELLANGETTAKVEAVTELPKVGKVTFGPPTNAMPEDPVMQKTPPSDDQKPDPAEVENEKKTETEVPPVIEKETKTEATEVKIDTASPIPEIPIEKTTNDEEQKESDVKGKDNNVEVQKDDTMVEVVQDGDDTTTTTTTTTVKPDTTTTSATTTTTTTAPNDTTTSSTTTTTSTTTTPVPTPSPVPTTTAKPIPDHDRSQFSVTAFIGGMVFAFGMMAIGFIAFKFYKARNERNYHTL